MSTRIHRATCPTPAAATALAAYLDERGIVAIVTDHMGLPAVEAECGAVVLERAPSYLVTRYYQV